MANKTADDASRRVLDARTGSLTHEATGEYLLELKNCLHRWIASIEEEIARRGDAESRKHYANKL